MFPFVLNQYTPPRFFLRDHNGNKVTQLFCVIPAIAPYHNYHNDGEIYLLTYFYREVEEKRIGQKTRLHTAQEFKQKKIFDLSKRYNVDI